MIECLEGECKCGHHCQNQRCGRRECAIELTARRFQQAEYAPIAIVQTEKKGFGVRASADLPACVRCAKTMTDRAATRSSTSTLAK